MFQSGSKQEHTGATLAVARHLYLVMVFLLAWMKTPFNIGGLSAFPTDAFFLAATALWLISLVRGEVSFRYHPAYWLVLAYLGAMALSLINSDDLPRSTFKLLTQCYLLFLPVLTFNLIKTMADMKAVVIWWLTGTAAVAILGVVTLLFYPLLGSNSVLATVLHQRTTLPPGPYIRFELTFERPAMLAHYLSTSLMLLLIGERVGWIRRQTALVLASAILLSALFTFTPGLGGMLFMLAVWYWYWARERRPAVARTVLAAGLAFPFVAVLLASVTTVHSTAPFLFHIPGMPTLAPAVRLLAWIDALENISQAPLLGIGIGLDAVSVYMQTNYCDLSASCVTDAHNTFLSIAVQSGLVGLAVFCAILWFVSRQIRFESASASEDVVVFGLALAWIAGMAMQGMVGSFEDTRHLWVLLGLLLSATSMPGRPLRKN